MTKHIKRFFVSNNEISDESFRLFPQIKRSVKGNVGIGKWFNNDSFLVNPSVFVNET